MIAKGAGGVCQYFITGGISFNTAGSYAAKIFSSLVRGIILNKLHFKTRSRKLGKKRESFLPKQELFLK